MQKEIERYRGEIPILDEINKSVKVKTRKTRKVKRKYEIKNQNQN